MLRILQPPRSTTAHQIRQANVLSHYAKIVFNNSPAKLSVTIPSGPNGKLPLSNFLTFGFCVAAKAANDFGFVVFVHVLFSSSRVSEKQVASFV
ncbi:hypothetical protein N9276_01975 [Rhodopirellula sp.]|nr:hypothetical protein [Rhodopirellula sp.]